MIFPEGSHKTRDAYFIVVIASGTGEDTARDAIQEMSLIAYRSLISPESAPHRPEGASTGEAP